MIDNVVAALGLGLNLTDEEIADVLWLAVQMQQFGDGVISEQGDRNEALDNSVSNRESPKQPAQPLRNADRDRQDENKEDDQNFEVHSKNDRGDDRSTRRSDELQLKIPDARSLQKPLELARSLRPLMRRVPSQVNTLLDEEATVRRIAEEKIWCPVLRPALEPWLDLALVIDDSASMLMWRHTIAELQHFLSSYGVFRDVRVWRLGTDKAEKVCIYAGAMASDRNGSPRSPSELIEANGRGLVLVVSDCIAPIWRNGAIATALQIWSRSGMVAILQMLPDWLWARTALGRGVAAQFSALAAGIPNYQLTTTTVSTWYDIDLATSIKIPVVTLEPEKFTAWAEMLAGKGGAWSAGIVFEPELFSGQEVAIEFDGAGELDAEDRVQSFRLTASPIARRLAGLLAAAPVISLPIVRILQSKVLDKAQPVHVAEVFLGGLLKPLSEITAKTNPNYVQYDFIEGVRDLLLDSVPSSEIVNVVAEVSEFVADRLGVSLEDFAAVIRSPQQVKDPDFAHQTRPFATLTAQILKRLGGEYAHFAEEIEQANSTFTARSQMKADKIDPVTVEKILDIVPDIDLELSRFYRACNPTHPLDSGNEEDRSYYVDLSTVRGEKLIESLSRKIVRISPDESTCQLFTGYIGCGKSTELLWLKHKLTEKKFHVAYFECDRQLELSDVGACDLLLAIAGQISDSLEKEGINIIPEYFKRLFIELKDILQTKLDLSANFKLSVGIAEVTNQAKNSPSLRRQMRERLESRTNSIINSINKELLAPAKERLKAKGMKGLVVIVDNLDRIENRINLKEQSRAGYLFVERGDQLRGLDCHVVYTVPLLLTFSNDAAIVTSRFGTDIKTVLMVPTQLHDGSECEEGMALLRQIVMARAFPKVNSVERISNEFVNKVFDNPKTLDRLCQASGGHVRNLFRLLYGCLEQDDPPITAKLVESIIAKDLNKLIKTIAEDEWDLIKKVQQDKRLRGESEYQTLIRSQFVFEYEYQGISWYDVNPLIEQYANKKRRK